jgi:hypothetical protein
VSRPHCSSVSAAARVSFFSLVSFLQLPTTCVRVREEVRMRARVRLCLSVWTVSFNLIANFADPQRKLMVDNSWGLALSW